MVERAEKLGNLFREGLKKINNPMVKIIRGKGLLNAIVIDESKTNGHSAWDLCMLFKEKGLLVGRASKSRISDKLQGLLTLVYRRNQRIKISSVLRHRW